MTPGGSSEGRLENVSRVIGELNPLNFRADEKDPVYWAELKILGCVSESAVPLRGSGES
jgi:hypothetical protein